MEVSVVLDMYLSQFRNLSIILDLGIGISCYSLASLPSSPSKSANTAKSTRFEKELRTFFSQMKFIWIFYSFWIPIFSTTFLPHCP